MNYDEFMENCARLDYFSFVQCELCDDYFDEKEMYEIDGKYYCFWCKEEVDKTKG